MEQLPPLPPTIGTISDEDAERLKAMTSDLWSSPANNCITCRMNGTFKMRRKGSVVEVECDHVNQWVLHRFLLNCGIPKKYQQASWEDVDSAAVPKGVRVQISEYMKSSEQYLAAGIGLILWGDKGTGKTLLGVLVLKELIGRGFDGYFTQFTEMLEAYKAGWRNEDERRWFARRVRSAGVLMVDDAGREHGGVEMVESFFDQVIRYRVSNNLPTIITTNIAPESFRQRYGDNVMSLLAESAMVYEVGGTDYRETAKERFLADVREGVVRPIAVPL